MSSQLGLFIQLMESQQFLSHLVLVACSHRVQRAEYEKLPRPLQARVDSIEGKDPLLSKENQLRALELLCWAASLHSWRYICLAVCASKFSMCPPNAVHVVAGLHVHVTGLHVCVAGLHVHVIAQLVHACVCVTELLVHVTGLHAHVIAQLVQACVCVTELLVQMTSIGAYCSET